MSRHFDINQPADVEMPTVLTDVHLLAASGAAAAMKHAYQHLERAASWRGGTGIRSACACNWRAMKSRDRGNGQNCWNHADHPTAEQAYIHASGPHWISSHPMAKLRRR